MASPTRQASTVATNATGATAATAPAKPSRLQLPMPDAENCRDRLLWFDHRVGNFLSEHDIPRAPDLVHWWMRDLDRKSLEEAFASLYTLVLQGTDGLQTYDNQYLSQEARDKRRVRWLRETNSDLLTENPDKDEIITPATVGGGGVNPMDNQTSTAPANGKRLPRLDDSQCGTTGPTPGTVPHGMSSPPAGRGGAGGAGSHQYPMPSKSPTMSLPSVKRLSGTGSHFGKA